MAPSPATMPTGSPTRSTNPVTTTPGCVRLGFSPGTPSSGDRWPYSVSTDCRVTGACPSCTPANRVAPIDRPIASAIAPKPARKPRKQCPPIDDIAGDARSKKVTQRIVPAPGIKGKSSAAHPSGRQVVDRGHSVQRPQPRSQAAGRGGVATGPVGEPKSGLLEDARRSLDVDAVDVVLAARHHDRCG